MTSTWTRDRRPETVLTMPAPERKTRRDDTTWHRFWLGASAVILFCIGAIMLVTATAGLHAGANVGLILLIFTLIGTIVDGSIIASRRRR